MVPVAALEPCEAQGRRPRNAFTPLVMESDDSDCESDASGSSAASYGSSCRMMDTAPADTVEDLRNATLWPFTGFTIVQAVRSASSCNSECIQRLTVRMIAVCSHQKRPSWKRVPRNSGTKRTRSAKQLAPAPSTSSQSCACERRPCDYAAISPSSYQTTK